MHYKLPVLKIENRGDSTVAASASLQHAPHLHPQTHVDGKEAGAGHNGAVSAREQAGIQHAENKQSRRIDRLKTNTKMRFS